MKCVVMPCLNCRDGTTDINVNYGDVFSAFFLLREKVDVKKFERAVLDAVYTPAKEKDRKRLQKIIGESFCITRPLSRKEKTTTINHILNFEGQDASLEVDMNPKYGCALLLRSSNEYLADKIMALSATEHDWIQNTVALQKIGCFGQSLFAARVFANYYGTSILNDVCQVVYHQPYHFVDTARDTILLRTGKIPQNFDFIFLADKGFYVLRNESQNEYVSLGERSGAEPTPNKSDNEFGVSDSNKSVCYLRRFTPIYNYRPCKQLRRVIDARSI